VIPLSNHRFSTTQVMQAEAVALRMRFFIAIVLTQIGNLTGSFQTRHSCPFLNPSLFRTSRLFGNDQYPKGKRQRRDFCEEFTVWHMATKCSNPVKFVKPWMLSHFSQWRDPSYVGSDMCPECSMKDWRSKSWLHPRESGADIGVGAGNFLEWKGYFSNFARKIFVRQTFSL